MATRIRPVDTPKRKTRLATGRPRIRRTGAEIQAGHVAESRALPPVAHMTTRNPYGMSCNHGGTCDGCGAMLGFWYHYKSCERCLKGVPIAASKGYYGAL